MYGYQSIEYKGGCPVRSDNGKQRCQQKEDTLEVEMFSQKMNPHTQPYKDCYEVQQNQRAKGKPFHHRPDISVHLERSIA